MGKAWETRLCVMIVMMSYVLLAVTTMLLYCKLPKICPPFFQAALKQKWGEGICSNIQCICPLPLFLANFFMLAKSTIMTTATEFWKNSSLLNAYYEKSAMLVFKLSHQESKQLASSVVTGTHMLTFPVRATESLVLSSE